MNNNVTSFFVDILNSCCGFCYFTSCWCRSIFHFFVVVNCTVCCRDRFWTVIFICVVDCTDRLIVFIDNRWRNHITFCVIVFNDNVAQYFFIDVSHFFSYACLNSTCWSCAWSQVAICCYCTYWVVTCWNKSIYFTVCCCDCCWFFSTFSCVVVWTWFAVCSVRYWSLQFNTVNVHILDNNVTSFLVDVCNFSCTFYNLTCFRSWTCLYFILWQDVVNCTIFCCNLSWFVICCIVSCTCVRYFSICNILSDCVAFCIYIVNNNITL